MDLTPINIDPLPEAQKSEKSQKFLVHAFPGTDLWRKPPKLDVNNAPYWIANIPADKFKRARVTVSANWSRQYDQGGLVLFLPSWPEHTLWVKTGIEFVDGRTNISTVAARDAADWSLLPAPEGQEKTTIEIEREEVDEKNGTGSSLWIYHIEGERRTAVREVTWVFKEKEQLEGSISVGFYGARPAKTGEDDREYLTVTCEGVELHSLP
ncbi:hypothetical protein BU17DRAFT_57388 [Hysterangium stoloniferum]|nr:hypothetical protein BU17DRAFT_57388 [Hysterangium stoloniferum]